MIKLTYEFASMAELKQFIDRLSPSTSVTTTTQPPKVDAVAEVPAKTKTNKTAAVDAVVKDESKVTIAEIVKMAVDKAGADPKAMAACKELCVKHGVKKLSELPEGKWAEVYEALKAL